MGPEFMALPLIITAVTCLGSILVTVLVGGGIAGVVYFVMKKTQQDSKLLQEGIAAQATLKQVWETGTYLNNQPQLGMLLEVRPPGGQPYQTQATAIVPMLNLHQFQPGALLNVKISRTDPSKVALDIFR